MSEATYRHVLALYPRRFRDVYGADALQLFRDRLRAETGFAARLRLWLDIARDMAVSLPHEHRRRPIPEHVLAWSGDGAPVFYVGPDWRPGRAALLNGAILSCAVFVALAMMIAHGGGHGPPLLIGSHHPSRSHLMHARTNAAPVDLDTEVKLPPYPADPRRSDYFRIMLVLDALDSDHDGVLSAAEIANAPASLRRLDRNRDGKLSAEECGAYFGDLRVRDPRVVQNARLFFMRFHPVLRSLDANHDGIVDGLEIRNAPAALATLDSNRDGRLTEDELVP